MRNLDFSGLNPNAHCVSILSAGSVNLSSLIFLTDPIEV